MRKFTVSPLFKVDLVKRELGEVLCNPDLTWDPFEAGSGVSYSADCLANQFPPVSLEAAACFRWQWSTWKAQHSSRSEGQGQRPALTKHHPQGAWPAGSTPVQGPLSEPWDQLIVQAWPAWLGREDTQVGEPCLVLPGEQALSHSARVSCPVTSNSLWPHGLQSSRLLCPWDSSGKNTGVRTRWLHSWILPKN